MQAHPEKTNIRDLSKKDLETWFIEHGEQKFRATQVWEWLWQKSARSFEGMSNLSKALRENYHFIFRCLLFQLTLFR